jgi:site-specific DNA recombinase
LQRTQRAEADVREDPSDEREQDMTTAAIYIRGPRVAFQEEACRGLCIEKGWTVHTVYVDAERGFAWRALLADIKADTVEVVVCWSLESLTRSLSALDELIELGTVHGLTLAFSGATMDLRTDEGRMVANMLTSASWRTSRREAEQGARDAVAEAWRSVQ